MNTDNQTILQSRCISVIQWQSVFKTTGLGIFKTKDIMLTHDDENHNFRSQFMLRLQKRADSAIENKTSQITTGKDGEEALATWKHKGVFVTHMPEDEQGILRISAGGGFNMPVKINYCTIRGSVGQCIQLLEKVIEALKQSPE